MKKFCFTVVIMLAGFAVLNAQQTQPTPPAPNPTPARTPSPSQQTDELIRRNARTNARFDALRNGGVGSESNRLPVNKIRATLDSLYGKPSKKERQLLMPSDDDIERFAEFLKQSDTGLIKLIPDLGCSKSTEVVVASEECLKYTMPGAGASYSFRVENYRIPRLADLTYRDKLFTANGILQHGILVNLGNVPLENVNMQTKGMKFFSEFKASKKIDSAKAIDQMLARGLEYEGFTYSQTIKAELNTTYALRSIAYRGKHYQAIQNYTYNELDYDKRKDIIIAFRIVSQDIDGSITMLWKKLEEKKSPELESD